MAMVAYRVAPTGEKWLVTRDGEPGMSYISQEAAYEVAVAEASGGAPHRSRNPNRSGRQRL
jgi:hypothetical protein